MLELKKIKKDYPAGDGVVNALKGIDLCFGKSEFVSILGPSGCGKTTLLNIIGGLDGYTDGDLIINGRSTKDFKDRDWDSYRNHSIGFVFQSYNLIPHQSVLQNVELALSLSGVGKAERRQRAKEALKRVGLESQYNKRPSEMSGGQMQRVAIARAIVNNPDIILADEPTGALDTETSVQVMEILKEISRDRLVIMVTHNPELAEKYSTRIIRMLDGEIMGDTNPATPEPVEAVSEKKKEKKPSMSFATSFSLSLKNLFTKKGRTILTSFAGSIGIIGIALILAVSQGMTSWINAVQEDTLSSYPITLEAQHMDLGTIMSTFLGTAESFEKHENDAVYQKAMMYDMLNALNNMEASENDLASFKKYIEEKKNDKEGKLHSALSGVQYSYGLDMLIYTESADGDIIESDSQELMMDLMAEMMGMDMSAMMSAPTGGGGIMSMMSTGSTVTMWQEMLPGDDGKPISELLEKQYDVVYGQWPEEYNEVVLVLDENNELDDLTLYALGLKPKADIDAIMDSVIKGTQIDIENRKWTYEEICAMEYRTILNSDCYVYDEITGTYTDLRNTDTGMRYLYNNGTPLKVSGIIKPSEDATAAMLTGSICYTHMLTEYVVEKSENSPAIKAQLADSALDIFTNLPFKSSMGTMTNAEKAANFKEYVSTLDEKGKALTYIAIKCIPEQSLVDASVEQTVGSMTTEDIKAQLLQAFTSQMSGMNENDVKEYLDAMSDEDILKYFKEMIAEQFKLQYAKTTTEQLSAMPPQDLAALLDAEMTAFTEENCAVYHDEVLQFSKSTYEDNLKKLGYVELDKPTSINLYASTFNDKDIIEETIAEYNKDVDDLSRITYTDYFGLMMSSVTTIINAITYVLVAFVAVSLVVSSIMIGVITLISVQERTKEIGILRAIGASKKNVSSMFNAETVIIGFTSGLLGVLITYLLCIPINLILHHLTGISSLSAQLPIAAAVILVAISVFLTLISGIIPSRSAAKKDPVVALRTE